MLAFSCVPQWPCQCGECFNHYGSKIFDIDSFMGRGSLERHEFTTLRRLTPRFVVGSSSISTRVIGTKVGTPSQPVSVQISEQAYCSSYQDGTRTSSEAASTPEKRVKTGKLPSQQRKRSRSLHKTRQDSPPNPPVTVPSKPTLGIAPALPCTVNTSTTAMVTATPTLVTSSHKRLKTGKLHRQQRKRSRYLHKTRLDSPPNQPVTVPSKSTLGIVPATRPFPYPVNTSTTSTVTTPTAAAVTPTSVIVGTVETSNLTVPSVQIRGCPNLTNRSVLGLSVFVV